MVAWLAEAQLYKPEGCGFDPQWCHWKFSLTQSFWPHHGPGVNSAYNRSEYQEYFLGGKGGQWIGLTLPPSCAYCHEIWQLQPPGILTDCPSLYRDCFTFTIYTKLFQQQCKNFTAMLLLNEITGTLCMADKNHLSSTNFKVIPWYLTKWLHKRLTR